MRDHFGPAEAPVNEIRVLTSKNEINVRGDIDRLELIFYLCVRYRVELIVPAG
jgi:hypothetical protein